VRFEPESHESDTNHQTTCTYEHTGTCEVNGEMNILYYIKLQTVWNQVDKQLIRKKTYFVPYSWRFNLLQQVTIVTAGSHSAIWRRRVFDNATNSWAMDVVYLSWSRRTAVGSGTLTIYSLQLVSVAVTRVRCWISKVLLCGAALHVLLVRPSNCPLHTGS